MRTFKVVNFTNLSGKFSSISTRNLDKMHALSSWMVIFQDCSVIPVMITVFFFEIIKQFNPLSLINMIPAILTTKNPTKRLFKYWLYLDVVLQLCSSISSILRLFFCTHFLGLKDCHIYPFLNIVFIVFQKPGFGISENWRCLLKSCLSILTLL